VCQLLTARYLDEQTFRYNKRQIRDGHWFDMALRQIVAQALEVGSIDGQQVH
jgi:hypothetical protein